MAKMKKYVSLDNERNLKRKDAKKNYADGASGKLINTSIVSSKKLREGMEDADMSNVRVKKRLPIAVDIIAGILLILLVIGAIVGSYLLFRYYSNDYESKSVSYSIVISASDTPEEYKKLMKKDVFLDTTANSTYFGRITHVEMLEGERDRVLITVSVTVKYRHGEGYSLGDARIAVGSEFTGLRCGERMLGNASVVKLTEN